MDDEKSLSELFTENGFTIVSVSDFIREADGKDVDELLDMLDRLIDLEAKMNSNANIVDFAKNILEKLDELESIVNMDEYARLSDASKIDTYTKDIKAMRAYFTKAQNFIRAEEDMAFQKQNVFDAMRKIYDLDKNKSIDDVTRTNETFRLYGEKKVCEAAYNKAYQTFIEQRKAYNDSVRDFNLVDFKNQLLVAINVIQIDCKDLALSEESKEKLQLSISSIRSDIAYYGLEGIRSKQEFDALCKRFGIEFNKNQKIATIGKKVESPKEEKTAQTEPSKSKPIVAAGPAEPIEPQYTGPVEEGQQLAVVKPLIKEGKSEDVLSTDDEIHRVFEELKKLNPGVELKLVGDPVNPKFDGRIESSKYVNSLHLPEDFYTINNGITNRFSSSKTPVLIEVGELKRTAEMPTAQPIVPTPENNSLVDEPEENLFDKAKTALSRLTQESRVAGGVKYGVKKVRKAIIGPYPKTFLTFSAVTAVVASIASAPVMASAVVGGGLGAIAQALYSKTVKGTDVKIKAFEDTKYEESPEKAPVLVAAWRKGSEALMDLYKKRKSGELKKAEEAEETLSPEEKLESLEQDLNQALGDYEENKSSIFDDVPSRSGR